MWRLTGDNETPMRQCIVRVAKAIAPMLGAGVYPAAVALGPEPVRVVSEAQYWEYPASAATFERNAARIAGERGSRFGAFGVALVAQEDDELGLANIRRPDHELRLRPGEFDQMYFVAFDLDRGLDMARCLYTRKPDGTADFGPIQVMLGDARVLPGSPGWSLLRAALDEHGG